MARLEKVSRQRPGWVKPAEASWLALVELNQRDILDLMNCPKEELKEI